MKRNFYYLLFVVFISLTSCSNLIDSEDTNNPSDYYSSLAEEYGLSVKVINPIMLTRANSSKIENEFEEISSLLGTHEFSVSSSTSSSGVVSSDSIFNSPLRIIPGGSSVENNSMEMYTRYGHYLLTVTIQNDFSMHNDYSISAAIGSLLHMNEESNKVRNMITTLCGEGNGTVEFHFDLDYTNASFEYSFYIWGQFNFNSNSGYFSVSSTSSRVLDGGF